jgi:hypothetical protein
MGTRLFQRRIENFECLHCGHQVQGNGFTNHCPQCLWSRHVDIHPGDRAADCKGQMQPISVTRKHQQYVILQRCLVCGFERKQKSAAEDSFEALLALASGRVSE